MDDLLPTERVVDSELPSLFRAARAGIEPAASKSRSAQSGHDVRRRTVDEDSYIWFSGRADEIIKIAGHRIGTIEVESACLKHPAVAECAVIGRPDDLRGEVISARWLPKGDVVGQVQFIHRILGIAV